jgi:hypothetical protein
MNFAHYLGVKFIFALGIFTFISISNVRADVVHSQTRCKSLIADIIKQHPVDLTWPDHSLTLSGQHYKVGFLGKIIFSVHDPLWESRLFEYAKALAPDEILIVEGSNRIFILSSTRTTLLTGDGFLLKDSKSDGDNIKFYDALRPLFDWGFFNPWWRRSIRGLRLKASVDVLGDLQDALDEGSGREKPMDLSLLSKIKFDSVESQKFTGGVTRIDLGGLPWRIDQRTFRNEVITRKPNRGRFLPR